MSTDVLTPTAALRALDEARIEHRRQKVQAAVAPLLTAIVFGWMIFAFMQSFRYADDSLQQRSWGTAGFVSGVIPGVFCLIWACVSVANLKYTARDLRGAGYDYQDSLAASV